MKLRVPVLLLFGILCWAGCSDDSTSPGIAGGSGVLKVMLTDAPGDYEKVLITFDQVAVHRAGDSAQRALADSADVDSTGTDTGEWIVLTGPETTFDLLTLNNGITALLGEGLLESGHYTQLRIAISAAEVVIDSVSYPMTVPSGTLKFVSGFEVQPDSTTSILVDFDAARSVNQTGNGQYKLKPTIRVITEPATAGSIAGAVANFEHNPTAYAIAGADTVTTTAVNPVNGQFTLSGLTGTFSVSVADTLGQSYQNPSVTVTAGEQTDLGTITLQ